MSDKRQCLKKVYSGARWDITGHLCGINATVERDGKWYCKRHDPVRIAERNAKALEDREARLAARDEVRRQAQKLCRRLGVGKPDVSTFGPTGGVSLTKEEAEMLANRLEAADVR